jgi:shikimate dehydrogenase
MPLKDEAFRLSIPSCPVAAATGVVNTLLHTDEGWEGYNTDSFGIMQALRGAGVTAPNKVAILGSGATARSAINAVKVLNSSVEIDVFARKTTTLMELETKPISEYYESANFELTISTLPGSVAHPRFSTSASSKIFDVAYDPWPSKLAANWNEQNRISGFEMLLWQAIGQLRLFVAGDGRVEFDNELKLVEIMRNSTRF